MPSQQEDCEWPKVLTWNKANSNTDSKFDKQEDQLANWTIMVLPVSEQIDPCHCQSSKDGTACTHSWKTSVVGRASLQRPTWDTHKGEIGTKDIAKYACRKVGQEETCRAHFPLDLTKNESQAASMPCRILTCADRDNCANIFKSR